MVRNGVQTEILSTQTSLMCRRRFESRDELSCAARTSVWVRVIIGEWVAKIQSPIVIRGITPPPRWIPAIPPRSNDQGASAGLPAARLLIREISDSSNLMGSRQGNRGGHEPAGRTTAARLNIRLRS